MSRNLLILLLFISMRASNSPICIKSRILDHAKMCVGLSVMLVVDPLWEELMQIAGSKYELGFSLAVFLKAIFWFCYINHAKIVFVKLLSKIVFMDSSEKSHNFSDLQNFVVQKPGVLHMKITTLNERCFLTLSCLQWYGICQHSCAMTSNHLKKW